VLSEEDVLLDQAAVLVLEFAVQLPLRRGLAVFVLLYPGLAGR